MSWNNSTGSLSLFIHLSCISLSGQTVSQTHWASFTESLPEGWICNFWIYFMQTWWVHLNLFTMKAKLISYALLKTRERVSLQQRTSRSVISAILPVVQHYNSSVSRTRINVISTFKGPAQYMYIVYCVCIFPTVLYYIKDTLMGLNVRCICDAIRSEYEITSGKQQPAHIIWQWLNLLLHTNFMETVPQDPRSHRGWFVSSKSIRSRLLLRVLIVCALDHVNTPSRRNILVRSFLASCCTMVPPVLSIAYA